MSNIYHHLQCISKNLDSFSSKYENFILLGDFNAEISNHFMEDFCDTYNLNALIKEATCFKNPERPTCIDHILTNHPNSFCNSKTIETGLSDFHKLTITVLRQFFKKNEPNIIKYRNYKKFCNDTFRENLLEELSSQDLQASQLEKFREIVLKVFDKHAPWKKKYIRKNQGPFMNKALRKAIMTRSRLLNKFRTNRSNENNLAYKKQRNMCVNLLRKSKKSYYNNLNVKSVTDNKLFWKSVKPCFSEKSPIDKKITLIENDKIVSKEDEVAESCNVFFSNAVKILNLKPPQELTQKASHIDDPIIKAIHKYQLHPSIIKIQERMIKFESPTFSFQNLSQNELEKLFCSLKSSKAQQQNDIPTQLMKENIDIFCPFITENFDFCLKTLNFQVF